MKITVFTSNQPRHIALIESLASISDVVYAVQECITVFPGQIEDFYKRTDVMQEYFHHVIEAENILFGDVRFLPSNVRSMSLKAGDLNKSNIESITPALDSDYYIVFGSSFIKGDLLEFLVSKRAINIHMGISPYYRGSSCNFWALYDKKPDYVGATIHLLSKGLDSGDILFHAVPKAEKLGAFQLGMHAVKAAHSGLVSSLEGDKILQMKPVPQNNNLEIRYTKNQDFNDDVALSYLKDRPAEEHIYKTLKARDLTLLRNPHIE